MIRFLRLIPTVLIAAVAVAAESLPLKFSRLDLRDGRTLENVVVKTYDARSGKLLLISDGKAMLIPIALVPPPFGEQLKKAPPSGETSSSTSGSRLPSQVSPRTRDESQPAITEPRHDAPARPEKQNEEVWRAHAEKALERATNFFQLEYQPGSNNITVTVVRFENSRPQPVEGWLNRFRTEGKVYLEYYNSVSRNYDRSTCTFEVLTEQKSGEEIKIVQFSRKS